MQSSYWGVKYACVAQNLKTSLSERTVTEIKGTHAEGKTSDDVEKVLIEGQTCPYLPINLGTHFKNLEVLYVMKSGVQHLTNVDLHGLTKLKTFDVSYNPITRLHKDFFVGHSNIEVVSFYQCELTFVEKGTLDPLTNLKEGHFQFNACVDYRGDDQSLLPGLMIELKHCESPLFTTTHAPHSPFDYGTNEDDYYIYPEMQESYDIFSVHHHVQEHDTEKTPEQRKPVKSNDSFVRGNVYLISSLLMVVIVALLGVAYKIHAFNSQNWR